MLQYPAGLLFSSLIDSVNIGVGPIPGQTFAPCSLAPCGTYCSAFITDHDHGRIGSRQLRGSFLFTSQFDQLHNIVCKKTESRHDNVTGTVDVSICLGHEQYTIL